jgi:D-serine dehydratase
VEPKTVLALLRNSEPFFWINPEQPEAADVLAALPPQYADILDAENRLARFAPLLAELFPELAASRGNPYHLVHRWLPAAAR